MNTADRVFPSQTETSALPSWDKAASCLLAAALFTYPLQQVGVEAFGYPVTPSFAAIVLFSILLLLRPMQLLQRWKIALLMLAWSAGTTLATGNLLSLRSVGVFALLLLPTVVEIPSVTKSVAVTWFVRGGILNLILMAVDAVRLKLALPQFDTIIPLIMPGSVEEWDLRYSGFPRIRALFFEPSLCAMYLAFLIICLDLIPDNRISSTKRNVLLVLFVLSALLCRGMAGYVILGVYAATRITLYAIGQYRRPRITAVGAAAALLLTMTVVAGLVCAGSLDSVEKWTVVPQRMQQAVVALVNPQMDRSSESERLGLFAVSMDYITSGSVEQIIAGEGFNSAEGWMSQRYVNTGGGWARGVMTSGFTILLLGTGLVGLALYLLYLRTLSPNNISPSGIKRPVATCCFIALILLQFGTGLFISYFLWTLVYVYMFILQLPQPQQAIRPPGARKRGRYVQ